MKETDGIQLCLLEYQSSNFTFLSYTLCRRTLLIMRRKLDETILETFLEDFLLLYVLEENLRLNKSILLKWDYHLLA